MKKQIIHYATLVLVAVTLGFTSCKKENKETKDYTPLFKNSVWTGEFNYPNGAVQPVSIEFAADGSLTFYELLGEFLGTWRVEDGLVVINLGSSISFKAGILDDNKLTDIKNTDANGRILKNATLSTTPDEVLDNTVWTYSNFYMKFQANGKALLGIGANASINTALIPYTRKGKSIRFKAHADWFFFMIPSGSTSMKGANKFTGETVVYPYVATRQ